MNEKYTYYPCDDISIELPFNEILVRLYSYEFTDRIIRNNNIRCQRLRIIMN